MNTLQHKGQYEEELHESPLLKTTCRYPAVSSQMNQKIETASTVLSQYLGVSTSYKYDAKGHCSASCKKVPVLVEKHTQKGSTVVSLSRSTWEVQKGAQRGIYRDDPSSFGSGNESAGGSA